MFTGPGFLSSVSKCISPPTLCDCDEGQQALKPKAQKKGKLKENEGKEH